MTFPLGICCRVLHPNKLKRFKDVREEYKIPLNPPLKKGGAKVLPFCKGELEGISETVLAQLGLQCYNATFYFKKPGCS
jgi:hypothetical protein